MAELRAIIDIGSNTVRLVVYNGPPRAPIVLLNEKVTPRLGRGVSEMGLLSEEAMETALAALARYAALLDLMSVTNVQTVATAAVRDADNGPQFLDAIGSLGLDPRLLSGEEEAKASATGVIAAFPGAEGVAGDLGGGSLELIAIGNDDCGAGFTLPFGTLRLPALREQGEKKFTRHVAAALTKGGFDAGKGKSFYIVGGSWRALAVYAMQVLGWPLDGPHDFELAAEDAAKLCAKLAAGEVEETVERISSARMATLPDAAALLGALIAAIEPSRIVFSSWGLREGLLHASLDPATRALDPVTASIAAFVERYDVSREIAALVGDWIADVLPSSPQLDRALRHAAAMLAMAAMRIEPNVRHEEILSWALGKRWIGLDARGRALITMAALANIKYTDAPDELSGLASGKELHAAVAAGLAIRVCRKLTGFTQGAMEASRLVLDGKTVVLHLDEGAEALVSSSVEKNLTRLADWLEMDWRIENAQASSEVG